MNKLRMQTANKADENFKKLAAMFPNAVTETIDENGEVVQTVRYHVTFRSAMPMQYLPPKVLISQQSVH